MATPALPLMLLDLLKADGIALRDGDKQKVGRCPRCGAPDGLIVTLSNERWVFTCQRCYPKRGDAIDNPEALQVAGRWQVARGITIPIYQLSITHK